MSTSKTAKLADIRRVVGDAKKDLRTCSLQPSEIAAGLIMEALIELYGLDYSDDIMLTITQRCIGYSEELMGLCVVEDYRRTTGAAEMRLIEEQFLGIQDDRNRTARGVLDGAARAVSNRLGPFPTGKDISSFRSK